MLRSAFEALHFTYFGADHELCVKFPEQYMDEGAAKKWDKIKAGTLFKEKGVIQDMTITRINAGVGVLPRYRFFITLRDMVEIVPPK